MFERISVRLIAGALLWSSALALLALMFQGRIVGVDVYSFDETYMRSVIRSIVLGSFVGAIFGAAVNVAADNFWLNVGSALFALIGMALAQFFATLPVAPSLEPYLRGLICYFAFIVGGAFVGRALRPWLKKMVPFGTK